MSYEVVDTGQPTFLVVSALSTRRVDVALVTQNYKVPLVPHFGVGFLSASGNDVMHFPRRSLTENALVAVSLSYLFLNAMVRQWPHPHRTSRRPVL
jgi:hypothetical protein